MRSKIKGSSLQGMTADKFLRAIEDLCNGAIYIPIDNRRYSKVYFSFPTKETLRRVGVVKKRIELYK